MKTTVFAVMALALTLTGCSEQDKRQARQDAKKTGDAVKKELKNDAAFVKQEALKAREETQKGVQKLKRDVNAPDTRPDDRSSRPDPAR